MKRIRTGIAGGAGYTGGELIRLLLRHPQAEIVFVHSRQFAGKPVTVVHKDLLGETSLKFSDHVQHDVDVLFLCLAHGESRAFITQHQIPEGVKVIDLSSDFRLAENAVGRHWIYGLPELNRDRIRTATSVANPGCFATAIQLALLPLAKAGKLGEVHVTGITGSTGAGAKLQDTLHFSWRTNNISAYKSLTHQHIDEIVRSLNQLQAGSKAVHFVPWRGDFARGIFASAVMDNQGLTADDARSFYSAYYATHPFTVVADTMIDLKMVVNTNKCVVYPEVTGNKLVVHAATDNLLKGASGQAVQNMNLMCGLEETAGLRLKALSF
jgi:N-acetyl-gamma-glutamyl-phosphate reductase